MTKTILLRSSWQTVNIGDIAHTPGMLRLMERYMPDTSVILWASHVEERGVAQMLRRNHANLHDIVVVGKDADMTTVFDQCDMLIHGSGPYLAGRKEVDRWLATGKPWGVLGVTLDEI